MHTKRARRPGSRAHNIIGVHYTELAAAERRRVERARTRQYRPIQLRRYWKSTENKRRSITCGGGHITIQRQRRQQRRVCVCVHNEPQPPSDKKNDRYYYVSYVFIFFVLFCRESPEIYERAKWQMIIIISYTHRIILLSCVLY